MFGFMPAPNRPERVAALVEGTTSSLADRLPVLVIFVVIIAIVAVLVCSSRTATPTRRLGLPSTVRRVYTRHITERMIQRVISEHEVEATLSDPDRTAHCASQESMAFEKDFPGRVLKVWVVRRPTDSWPPRSEVVLKSTAWKDVYAGPVRPPRCSRSADRS